MSEAAPEDVAEQQELPEGGTVPRGAAPDVDVPLEASAPDAAEQAAGAAAPDVDVPLEADPADAADQAAEVGLDEDDRR